VWDGLERGERCGQLGAGVELVSADSMGVEAGRIASMGGV